MIYEVLNKLIARGAVLSSMAERTTLYMPMAPDELLDGLRHEFEEQLDAARRRWQPSPPPRGWTMSGTSRAATISSPKRAR